MSLTGDGAPRELRAQADAEERSLNDQLAEEARKVELAGRARLAARGSKHDPEL